LRVKTTRRQVLGLFALTLLGRRMAVAGEAPAAAAGTIVRHEAFASRLVPARNVDVWLPPGYADGHARYPVVYMHDGQNVFDAASSSFGEAWEIDEVLGKLVAEGAVRPAIVVAIWNTGMGRYAEYMPPHNLPPGPIRFQVPSKPVLTPEQLVTDQYLRFIVSELKPFIDQTYRTLPGPADTFVMGSSMGGLISAYAVAEYPDIFGGAACVSTHWPAADGAVIDHLTGHLPDPASHRFYFDYGTATLDALYEPYQQRMDAVMRQAGYVEGQNWVTLKFDGAEHNEEAWRQRASIPLRFLLGSRPAAAAP
jgi:predicted alpha/beta superfamily hydrolase